MLSLAKVEQLRQQPESERLDWAEIARDVALDLSALIADKAIDFEFDGTPTPVRAHRWMLQELTRNLLHNAIKHSPPEARLWLSVGTVQDEAVLTLRDEGPGIPAELRQRLFAPFAAGNVMSGSGLGLAISREIVQTLRGSIALDNLETAGFVTGLNAVVRLPLDNDEYGTSSH